MKINQFWIEIVALVTAIAFALALLIATLGAAAMEIAGQKESGAAAKPTDPQSQVYEGMITDMRCGAKHEASLGKTATDCVRICVHRGDQFALLDGDKTYQLEGDLGLLKKVAGQRARVVGVIRGRTIRVTSAAAAS